MVRMKSVHAWITCNERLDLRNKSETLISSESEWKPENCAYVCPFWLCVSLIFFLVLSRWRIRVICNIGTYGSVDGRSVNAQVTYCLYVYSVAITRRWMTTSIVIMYNKTHLLRVRPEHATGSVMYFFVSYYMVHISLVMPQPNSCTRFFFIIAKSIASMYFNECVYT